MVAYVPVARCGVEGCKGQVVVVAFRLEVLQVFPSHLVVVHAPDIQDDGRTLRQKHAVDVVVFALCQIISAGVILNCFKLQHVWELWISGTNLQLSRVRLRAGGLTAICVL